jgi:hypothetical protein
LAQLKERLLRNAKVQEGDLPAEDPNEMVDELERVADQLQRLIQQINKTNSITKLRKDLTIADAIAVRDVLRIRHSVYRALAEAATVTATRYSRSEVKFQSTVNVAEIQKKVDSFARDYRELDSDIQAANWLTELVE